jgi:pyrroline-5-carboxylate reductase
LSKLTKDADIVVLAVKPQESHKMLSGTSIAIMPVIILQHNIALVLDFELVGSVCRRDPILIESKRNADLHTAVNSEEGRMANKALLVSLMAGKTTQW